MLWLRFKSTEKAITNLAFLEDRQYPELQHIDST